eukprot:11017-Heterococcus_DN1.PRE.3
MTASEDSIARLRTLSQLDHSPFLQYARLCEALADARGQTSLLAKRNGTPEEHSGRRRQQKKLTAKALVRLAKTRKEPQLPLLVTAARSGYAAGSTDSLSPHSSSESFNGDDATSKYTNSVGGPWSMGLYAEGSTSCLLLDGEPSQYASDCSTVQLPQVAHKGKKHLKSSSSSRYAATTAEQTEAAEAAAVAATFAHTLFAMGLDSEHCDHTMRRMQQRLRPAYARQLAWLVLVKAGAAAMTAAKPMQGPEAAVKRTVPLPLAGHEDAILAIHRVPHRTGDFVSVPLGSSCASRSELEGCNSRSSTSRWQGSNSTIDVRFSSGDLQQQQYSVYETTSGLQSGSLQTFDAATTATSTTTLAATGSHPSAAAASDAGVWRESVSHSSSSVRAAEQQSRSLAALSLAEPSLCNNNTSSCNSLVQDEQQQGSVLSLSAQLRAAVPSTRDRDIAAALSKQQARARAADAVQRKLNGMLAEAARRAQAAQDKAAAAQTRARQTLWLQLVLHSARLAHFKQSAAALGAARLRKQHERQLLSATLCVQKLWRAYYLKQFMAQNKLKLLPVTRMGMKWRLLCRARKKRACQPLLLFVVREAAMASKVDIAITSFRLYYRRLHSAASAFVRCRRARVLALMKLWVLEEPVRKNRAHTSTVTRYCAIRDSVCRDPILAVLQYRLDWCIVLVVSSTQ